MYRHQATENRGHTITTSPKLGWSVFGLALAIPIFFLACQDDRESATTAAASESQPLVFETIGFGFHASLRDTTELLLRTSADWREVSVKLRPIQPFAVVDSTQMMVMVAAVPASTGGYRVSFESVEEIGEEILGTYIIHRPGPDCITTAALSFPFAAIAVQRTEGRARFVHREEDFSCST